MSTSKKTVTAAVIVIGNEILSGRTQDKNVAHIALTLNEVGVRLSEVRVVTNDALLRRYFSADTQGDGS